MVSCVFGSWLQTQLCSSRWPWASDSCASASQVLALQTWATMSSWYGVLLIKSGFYACQAMSLPPELQPQLNCYTNIKRMCWSFVMFKGNVCCLLPLILHFIPMSNSYLPLQVRCSRLRAQTLSRLYSQMAAELRFEHTIQSTDSQLPGQTLSNGLYTLPAYWDCAGEQLEPHQIKHAKYFSKYRAVQRGRQEAGACLNWTDQSLNGWEIVFWWSGD